MNALAPHARRRAQQRGVQRAAIAAAQDWGMCFRMRDGRRAWFLGYRHVDRARRAGVDVRRFENTAVVIAADQTVITVIRTRDPSRLRRFAALRHGPAVTW